VKRRWRDLFRCSEKRGEVRADPGRAARTDSIVPGNGGYPGYDYVLPFGE
jgi:hypothetical protein